MQISYLVFWVAVMSFTAATTVGPWQIKKERTDLEVFKIVFKVHGNVFYGIKARDYAVKVLNNCYGDMI